MTRQPDPMRELFLAALKLPSNQRQAYLREACGEDRELEAQVESLIAAHDELGSIEKSADFEPTQTFDRPVESIRAGDVFAGRYKLLEQIGEGGMGTVWMAEQTEPVQRRVAVKLIKTGMDSRQVVARFEAERQALALMDHANIAKVFDGGATPNGRPFFVIELVKGTPITKFCDEKKFSVQQRLELFADVCRAVQHAHQKGIIHRDIKPSNVLVAPYDGRPVVKVIDFGVAKATGQKLTEATLFTGFGAVVGTPEYMSPEQAEVNNQDVDTRSDIYSLGVLLYELLTGSTPLTRKRVQEAALLEVLRVIREEEPPKPSTRLSSTDELPSISANRHTEPARLTKLVRGELDWIAMKALEKDRNRRYETANGFATDIQRYLADEQVLACPPSANYRLRKFVRRHRVLLATTGGFIGLLVAGTIVSSWQAVRAHRAEVAESEHRHTAERNEQIATSERNKALEATESATAALKAERFTAYVQRVALAHREWLAGEVASALRVLEDCPPEFRDWEWRYVRRLCNTELAAFRAHADEPTSVTFSPDGSRVASVSKSGVHVWLAETGEEVYRITGNGGVAASFRPDGKRLAVAWTANVTVHDAANGNELLRYNPHDDSPLAFAATLTAVAYSPNGQRLATTAGSVSDDLVRDESPAAVKVWDAENGKEILRFVDRRRPIARLPNGIVFSADGKYFAVSIFGLNTDIQEKGEVHVRDAVDGRLLHQLEWYPLGRIEPRARSHHLTGVAISSDSKRIAASGSDGTVRIWELSSGRPVMTFQASTKWLNCLAFSQVGDQLVTAGADRCVRIWDSTTGKDIHSIFGHTEAVRAVAFSPSGKRVASVGGEVRVWDATTSQQTQAIVGDSNASGVDKIAFSPNSRYLALMSNHSLRLREVATGIERSIAVGDLRAGTYTFSSLSFRPDGSTIATLGSGGVMLWDVATRNKTQVTAHHPKEGDLPAESPFEVMFSPDGRRLATIGRLTFRILELDTGRVIHRLRIHPQSPALVGGVAFSPDGRRMAIATKAQPTQKVPLLAEVKFWDVELGQQLASIPGGGSGMAFSPDGTRLASGNPDGTVTVWDTQGGAVAFKLHGHTDEVRSLEFSPDGRRLATASNDQSIRIWDPRYGKEVFVLRGHDNRILRVKFSQNGYYLASVSVGAPSQIRLWDARPVKP